MSADGLDPGVMAVSTAPIHFSASGWNPSNAGTESAWDEFVAWFALQKEWAELEACLDSLNEVCVTH